MEKYYSELKSFAVDFLDKGRFFLKSDTPLSHEEIDRFCRSPQKFLNDIDFIDRLVSDPEARDIIVDLMEMNEEEVPMSYREYINSFIEDSKEMLRNVRPNLKNMVIRCLSTDPEPILALGKESRYINSSPFIYTALRERELPVIRWEKNEGVSEYEFVLLDILESSLCDPIKCFKNEVNLADIIEIAEDYYEWRVFSVREGEKSETPWVHGIFFWLSQNKELPEIEQKILRIEEDIGIRKIALACLYGLYPDPADISAGFHLYDEALKNLREMIEKNPGDIKTVPFRRTLILIYNRVYSILNNAERGEASILRNLANEQIKQIRCLLSGNYAIYENGECETCNKCGLI